MFVDRRLASVVRACRVLALLATAAAYASGQIDSDTVNLMTCRGEYAQAIKTGLLLLQRARSTGRPDRDSAFTLAYLGRAYAEIGRLSDAEDFLRVSGSTPAQGVEVAHAAVVACERAALDLARLDYPGSRDQAAKARRLVLELGRYRSWLAYCQALLAMAQIRLHEPALAEQAFGKALDTVPKDPAKLLLFAPRILYTAALIESRHGNHALARQYCERALDALQRARISSRDVSLGLLTLAEIRLVEGEATAAREAATKSLDTTRRLFGSQHQDAVGGLEILAQIAAREGRPAEARERANEAEKLAATLFGEGSPGVRVVRRTLEELASGTGGR